MLFCIPLALCKFVFLYEEQTIKRKIKVFFCLFEQFFCFFCLGLCITCAVFNSKYVHSMRQYPAGLLLPLHLITVFSLPYVHYTSPILVFSPCCSIFTDCFGHTPIHTFWTLPIHTFWKLNQFTFDTSIPSVASHSPFFSPLVSHE